MIVSVVSERSLDILLVDDHPLVRTGLRHLLEGQAYVANVREADSVERALAILRREVADVVLLDLALPGIDGEHAARLFRERFPALRVVIVSAQVSAPSVRRLAAVGIDGFVSKNSGPDDILGAIESVSRGERYWCPEVAACLVAFESARDEADPFDRLSERELAIVNGLLEGGRNREIARRLHLSEKTVSTYRSRAFEKLDIDSAPALFRLAMRHGRWFGR